MIGLSRNLIRGGRSLVSVSSTERPVMRALEPRILLDAAGLETAIDTLNASVHNELTDAYFGDSHGPDAPAPFEAHTAPVVDHLSPAQFRTEIAFIAHDVTDIGSVVASLSPDVVVVLLEPEGDGLAQIADALSHRSNVDAVHIISHGQKGSLDLGGQSLTAESMTGVHAEALKVIGDAMSADGDILVYGCDFAAGDVGQEALQLLADLTGADVAGSADVTGHLSLGGDWDLEQSTGAIESRILSAGASWHGTLAAQILVAHEPPISGIDHNDPIGSVTTGAQSFQYDSGTATYQLDQVDLVLRLQAAAPAQNVTVAIRNGVSGPDLASGTIASSALQTTYDWHTFTLDSVQTLNSNQSYYIVAYTDDPSDTVEVGVEHDGTYADGQFVRPGTDDDALFRLIDTTANSDPTITSDGGGGVAFVNMDENQTLATTVTATDPDIPADTLTYSITGGIDETDFTIDASTGELSFIAAPDFENPTDNFPTNNIYTVLVTVSDGRGGTDVQSISVVIQDVNDQPVVGADTFAVAEDGSVTVDVLANDSDQDGDALTITQVDGQAIVDGGAAVAVADGLVRLTSGSLVFTPAANFNGAASFSYVVSDGNGGTNTATVSGTVSAVNDVPVATGGIVSTAEDTPRLITAADFGFTDVEGDALQSVTISNLALAGGTLTHSGGAVTVMNGMTITAAELAGLTFMPALNSTAGAGFDYTVNDAGSGIVSAAMTITVTPVNDVPVATGGIVSTAEDTPRVITAADFGFTDVEGDALQSVTIFNLALAGGTLTHSGGAVTVTNGMTITAAELAGLTFTPALNSTAGAGFDYTVNDAGSGIVSAAMTITVTPVNDVPVATGGIVSTVEDTPRLITAADFGFTDVEGDALQSVTIFNLALAGGTLTHSGGAVTVTNGMTITAAELAGLTFTPALNSTAGAGFDYTVNDAGSGIVSAAMTITVTPVNDVPVATGGIVSTVEDTPRLITAADFGFTDVEGDALQSVTISNLALAGGTLTHSGGAVTVTNGMTITATELAGLTFTPAAGSMAGAGFDYTVNDAGSGIVSAAMTITVTPVNDVPVATGGAVSTAEDTPRVISAADFGFTDVEGDALQSVTISNLALAGGTLTHSGGAVTVTNGMTITAAELAGLTFMPALNSTAGAGFDYTVNDAGTGIVSAAMTITVTPVNDAPVATGGVVSTTVDNPLHIKPADFKFVDPEGDPLASVTFDNVSLAGGTLTYSAGTATVVDGLTLTAPQLADLTFTPAAGSTAIASFDYTVNDADPGIARATMTISTGASVLPGDSEPPAEPPGVIPSDPTVATGLPDPLPENPGLPPLPDIAPPPDEVTAPPEIHVTPAEPGPVIEVPKLPSGAVDGIVVVPTPDRQPVPIAPAPVVVSTAPAETPDLNYNFTRIEDHVLARTISRSGDEVRQHDEVLHTVAAKVTFTFGSLLSVGGATFVLRGGAVVAALLSAMPAWSRFDPIAIVSGRRDDKDDEEPADVDMMLEYVREARSRVKGGGAE